MCACVSRTTLAAQHDQPGREDRIDKDICAFHLEEKGRMSQKHNAQLSGGDFNELSCDTAHRLSMRFPREADALLDFDNCERPFHRNLPHTRWMRDAVAWIRAR